jgi:hypothetical protein
MGNYLARHHESAPDPKAREEKGRRRIIRRLSPTESFSNMADMKKSDHESALKSMRCLKNQAYRSQPVSLRMTHSRRLHTLSSLARLLKSLSPTPAVDQMIAQARVRCLRRKTSPPRFTGLLHGRISFSNLRNQHL